MIRTGTWGLAGTPGAPAKDGGQAANMKSFDLSVSKAVSTIYENQKINLSNQMKNNPESGTKHIKKNKSTRLIKFVFLFSCCT